MIFTALQGHLITPIVMVVVDALSLCLEVLGFFEDWQALTLFPLVHWQIPRQLTVCSSSPFNLMDVVGFLLPTIGCIQLLFSVVVNDNTETIGKPYLLSYGLAIAYIEIVCRSRSHINEKAVIALSSEHVQEYVGASKRGDCKQGKEEASLVHGVPEDGVTLQMPLNIRNGNTVSDLGTVQSRIPIFRYTHLAPTRQRFSSL
jgi:hypothetical protein